MSESKSTNIVWHEGDVTPSMRHRNMGQRGCTIWLTGLSGSGKSTIAVEVEKILIERGRHAFRLDGDNVRHGLSSNLGFTAEDRKENIRRIGEVTKLFAQSGMITLNSFISPFREERTFVRQLHEQADLPFFEVYVHCPLDEAEKRDPKGLYQKARAGEIANFTGIDSPFEEPQQPQLRLPTHELTVEQCVQQLLAMLDAADIFNV